MRSHLLEGKVRHRRARPVRVRARARRLLPRARPRRARRGGAAGPPRRPQPAEPVCRSATATTCDPPAATCATPIRAHLRGEGVDPDGWRITLVTNLRVFGYVFNPASFYLCRDAGGRAPGRDRRGPQHPRRAAPVHAPAGAARAGGASWPRWTRPSTSRRSSRWSGGTPSRVRDEPARLRIVDQRGARTASRCCTRASILRRRPLTDRTLARMLVRHPFVTQKTIGLIHWHALRLWRRGAPFHRHGAAAR